MKNHIFIDAEIVLDMAIADRSGHKAALELLDAIEKQSIRASICSTDLPSMQAELTRCMGKDDARVYLQALVDAFDVATVGEGVCRQALQIGDGPFPDAVLQVCAEQAAADYIVTSRTGVFKRSNIKAIDAARYLQSK